MITAAQAQKTLLAGLEEFIGPHDVKPDDIFLMCRGKGDPDGTEYFSFTVKYSGLVSVFSVSIHPRLDQTFIFHFALDDWRRVRKVR